MDICLKINRRFRDSRSVSPSELNAEAISENHIDPNTATMGSKRHNLVSLLKISTHQYAYLVHNEINLWLLLRMASEFGFIEAILQVADDKPKLSRIVRSMCWLYSIDYTVMLILVFYILSNTLKYSNSMFYRTSLSSSEGPMLDFLEQTVPIWSISFSSHIRYKIV